MAVDVSQIDLGHESFNNALKGIIEQRDKANDELNSILDPIVENLGGDPDHLRFASKKINYILENENAVALTKTLEEVKFNYNKRLDTISNLAKNAEAQVIIKQKALAVSDEIIESCSEEIKNIQIENEKLEVENAAMEAEKKSLEDSLSKLEKEITELQKQEENSNFKRGLKQKGEYENQESPLEKKIEQQGDYRNQIAKLEGKLAGNKKKMVSVEELNNLIARRDEYVAKQAKEYANLDKQKTKLVNEFKKDKITLNFGDSVPEEQEKAENGESTSAENASKAKAGGAAGAGASTQATGMIEDERTPKELVQDMYKRLMELGKIDAETRKRILSGMGYSDLIDMTPGLSNKQRRNVQALLNATLKDLGRLDNEQAENLDRILEDKFGVSDAYSILVEGDFAKLSEEELSDIKKIMDTFNQNPGNYTREEQIMIDEFAKRVSLKTLSYHMGKAGVFGRLFENFSPESQSRKDILASFNTFSQFKSANAKTVAENDFVKELGANVKTDDEISMDPRTSIRTKQKQRSTRTRS